MRLARSYVVYEARDATGLVLYVGVTGSFGQRMAAHFADSQWSGRAATITLTRYPNRAEAFEAEGGAIRALKPLFNDSHNPIRRRATTLRNQARREQMAAEHLADPDCPYHWRQGCRKCNEELNSLIPRPGRTQARAA